MRSLNNREQFDDTDCHRSATDLLGAEVPEIRTWRESPMASKSTPSVQLSLRQRHAQRVAITQEHPVFSQEEAF